MKVVVGWVLALVVAVGTGVAVEAGVGVGITPSASTSLHRTVGATEPGPPEGSPIANVDGQINGLGIFTYPDAYVGVEYADNDRALTVYVAPSRDDPVLETTIESDAQAASIPVNFVLEPLSEASFTPDVHALGSAAVVGDGVRWADTNLDPPTDTLEVRLLAPSRADLTELSRALAARLHESPGSIAVTYSDYLPDANRLLQILLGSHVRVVGLAGAATAI